MTTRRTDVGTTHGTDGVRSASPARATQPNPGDFTSLVTNPPTSDKGVTSTFGERASDEQPLSTSLPFFEQDYDGCWCAMCDDRLTGEALNAGAPWYVSLTRRMNLCPDCGDKRCPRATEHSLACAAPSTAASVDESSSLVVVSSASPSTGDQQ